MRTLWLWLACALLAGCGSEDAAKPTGTGGAGGAAGAAGAGPVLDPSLFDCTLSGIPDQAHEYMLGGRSALDWIIDRYQVKTDKKSGITNDPNSYSDDPRYIIDLVQRITTVSVRTVEVVEGLPPLRIGP